MPMFDEVSREASRQGYRLETEPSYLGYVLKCEGEPEIFRRELYQIWVFLAEHKESV